MTYFSLVRPHMAETTSLGAAIAAALAEGINSLELKNIAPGPKDIFTPKVTEKGKTCDK